MAETNQAQPQQPQPPSADAGNARPATPASPAPTAAATAVSRKRTPKAGDRVHIVHANKKLHLPATVHRVRPDVRADRVGESLCDVVIEHPEYDGMEITSSPHDATASQPDSWHFADAEHADDAPAAA